MQDSKMVILLNTSGNDIYDKIISLDSSKVHGWGNISMKLLKLCGQSLIEPRRT